MQETLTSTGAWVTLVLLVLGVFAIPWVFLFDRPERMLPPWPRNERGWLADLWCATGVACGRSGLAAPSSPSRSSCTHVEECFPTKQAARMSSAHDAHWGTWRYHASAVTIACVDLSDARVGWEADGFVVMPRYLSAEDVSAAVRDIRALFPTADEFHTDPKTPTYAHLRSEFGGIVEFPFAGVELSLLSVHPALTKLAGVLLGTEDLRVYSIEAWAKYTGAADFDQHHHRDFLNHTLLVPSGDVRYRQVEMFVYLSDVPPELGPPAFVPRRYTEDLAAIPNWLPRQAGAPQDEEQHRWISPDEHQELYDVEVSAAGPAGTVVAYTNATFHRGTALTRPRAVRYTLHVNYRPAAVEWAARHSWVEHANSQAWHDFVARASPRQLAMFGFPPPGHPYWTASTLADTKLRYPNLDLTPWST